MSTYLYLECADHAPPLRSRHEVGQHLRDLPAIFGLIHRRHIQHRLSLDHAHEAVAFLAAHPDCTIRVVDEYGQYHEERTPTND